MNAMTRVWSEHVKVWICQLFAGPLSSSGHFQKISISFFSLSVHRQL